MLESVEGGVKWARYSFIGTDPFMLIHGKNGEMVIEDSGEKQILRGKPIELLKAHLRAYRSPAVAICPLLPAVQLDSSVMICSNIMRSFRRIGGRSADE